MASRMSVSSNGFQQQPQGHGILSPASPGLRHAVMAAPSPYTISVMDESSWSPEVDEVDPSQYPSLQAAYAALSKAYKRQRQTFGSCLSRWKLERQELKSGEESLVQALQAVRDALEAETRAHDMDLQTLETFMTRNKMLESELAAQRQSLAIKHTSDYEDAAQSRNGRTSDPGEVSRSSTHSRDTVSDCRTDGVSSVIHSFADTGLKSVLKNSHEIQKPVTGTGAGGQGSVVGLQRYCPETDSYRLVRAESSVNSHEELRKNNMVLQSLTKQVDELRKVNHDLLEAYERQPHGQRSEQHLAHLITMSGHHFAPSSASAAAHHEAQLFPHQTHALPHSYHGTVPAQDTPNSYHASATSLHTTPPPHPGLPLSARPISPLMHVPPGQRSFTPTLPGSYSYLHSAAYVSQQPTASLVPKNRPSPIFNPMPHGQASNQALTYNQPNGHLPTYSQKKSPSEGHASYDRGELERQWRPNSLAWRDADGMNA